MRVLIFLLIMLVALLIACDDLAQVQDETSPPATPLSPATPE